MSGAAFDKSTGAGYPRVPTAFLSHGTRAQAEAVGGWTALSVRLPSRRECSAGQAEGALFGSKCHVPDYVTVTTSHLESVGFNAAYHSSKQEARRLVLDSCIWTQTVAQRTIEALMSQLTRRPLEGRRAIPPSSNFLPSLDSQHVWRRVDRGTTRKFEHHYSQSANPHYRRLWHVYVSFAQARSTTRVTSFKRPLNAGSSHDMSLSRLSA